MGTLHIAPRAIFDGIHTVCHKEKQLKQPNIETEQVKKRQTATYFPVDFHIVNCWRAI